VFSIFSVGCVTLVVTISGVSYLERLISKMTSEKCVGINPFECWGSYSATLNDIKLVHWPLMGGLLHLVQLGGDWVGCSPTTPLLTVPNVTAHPSTASVPQVHSTAVCSWWPMIWWSRLAKISREVESFNRNTAVWETITYKGCGRCRPRELWNRLDTFPCWVA